MSALNAFARSDGAWLATDSASYDHSGRVLAFGAKVQSRADIRLAIGHAGRFSTDVEVEVDRWLCAAKDQRTALAELPALLSLLESHDVEAIGNGALTAIGDMPAGMRLIAAAWSDDGLAEIIAISTTDCLGVEPRTLRTIRTMFSPPIYPDPWPGHSFSPSSDLLALADHQRNCTDERGIHRVGGQFQAWRVHGGGIDHFQITEWPDVIGEPLRVSCHA